MARISYLYRRGAVYYALLDIPADLVDHYKAKQRWKSLKTKDGEEAKKRLNPVIDSWRAEFDDIRARRELTADDRSFAVWQHYESTLKRDDENRRTMPTPKDIALEESRVFHRIDSGEIGSADFIGMINAHTELELMLRARTDDANNRARRFAALKAGLVSGDYRMIEQDVQDFISQSKLLVKSGTDEYRELCSIMIRAEVEALQRTIERDSGDYTGAPKDPLVKPASGVVRERAKVGETITEIFDIYARQNPNGVKGDTLNQARRDIGTLIDYIGANKSIRSIDKKAVREWKSLLLQYPVKATETNAFAGMNFAQIIRHNTKVGKPVISTRTVNRYLSGLSAFCQWAVNHGYIDSNPTDGMFLAKTKAKSPTPFTSEQLNELLRSPLFIGCHSADEWRFIAKQGDVKIRDHRYWVPLIMLFSGARPAEIAQLNIDDVRQEHGHWIMHITETDDDDKSVKNEGSKRIVPIHEELIKIGFLKYYDAIKQGGERKLFPHAKRNSRGQMIADYSREFGRYLERIGMKDGRGLSLYSFRHGAVDALRRAGYLNEQFGYLLGHSGAGQTKDYGILPQGMLEQRVELVNAIAYPDLKIDHLI